MGFEAIVVDPLGEAVPAQWGEMSDAAGLAATWDGDLLRALAWYSTRRTLMGVVLEDGRPCALFHASHLGVGRGGRFVLPGGRPPTGPVMCHLPPGITTAGYAFHPALDAGARSQAVAAFERGVADRLGPRCMGLVYRQVADRDLAVFRRRGRIVRPAVPESVLRNEWDSMEDYFRELPARHRKNLRRAQRRVQEDPSLRTVTEPGIPGADAALLLGNVQARHSTARGAFPAMYYQRLSGRDGVNFFTYRDRAEDLLLAFGLLIDDGTVLRCQGWGTRRDDRRHLYFDHFLRQIGHLIEHKREEMVMGKTMPEEKARFGARLAPLHTVASIR